MKITSIIRRVGVCRAARFTCEHCRFVEVREFRMNAYYLSTRYHTRVIPAMICQKCGKDRSGRQFDMEN